ncbi:MAG: di-trans,poly-cis-decaprenylcistransferase [Omnitrophica WOR_2 bacterium RIFCSPHIGHO2_01_FULL_48_9]|nr:MAG: di-trans,poly-cis-decaprenylcistransferase [Omnitrophica WOR_2 bacterium RIFCSPHIGHO2_02_FULL_48_11]OGX33002.1 MAG: di-trans,poly-cis-decaprenylcistransferase [Omnitrophica WOR_2 bacterium RIFCSPHIGHO2_01_FULL_48_9]
MKGTGKVKPDKEDLPQHVAIIMDGNGRWAKNRNLPRTRGHMEGVRRVEEIIDAASALGIKVLTLFTFSTENWNRPQAEVAILMRTLSEVLVQKIGKLNQKNIRFQLIGREAGIPKEVWQSIHTTMKRTEDNTGMILNMAFNYGARVEILDAVKKIVKAVQEGKLQVEDIDEATMDQALYTRGLPDPDLLIRTSGEKRISNFLLWQCSYAEFYFTEKCWPDFDEEEFKKAVEDFQSRERRYGKVEEGS